MGKKKILVAPLNWGLGHATRCIPIIKELQYNDLEPIIASDGDALALLRKEFPKLTHIELPPYNIEYSRKASLFKWKMIMESPKIVATIRQERLLTKTLVKEYGLSGIISDNRFGVRSKLLKKNVFITHQLNVLSGNTTFLSSYLHQRYINKFEQCWIPDLEGEDNLSGILGHPKEKPDNVKYIGLLSRLKKRGTTIRYKYLILLSGPEPQRSILESILLKEFRHFKENVLLVRGVMNNEEVSTTNPNIIIKNNLYGKSLEEAINNSKFIISRSGYTTLMDLSRLNKKAFFIPTPGQKEQEYLAKRLEKKGIAPFSDQNNFELEKLREIDNYKGLSDLGNHTSFRDLFTFFHSE